MESVFGERSDALARDLGNGTAQLDLNPVHRATAGAWCRPDGARQAWQQYRAAMEQRYGRTARAR